MGSLSITISSVTSLGSTIRHLIDAEEGHREVIGVCRRLLDTIGTGSSSFNDSNVVMGDMRGRKRDRDSSSDTVEHIRSVKRSLGVSMTGSVATD